MKGKEEGAVWTKSIYYPPAAFGFTLALAGSDSDGDVSFSEVSGLSPELKTIALREGGDNRFAHRLPGETRQMNLVARRGLMPARSELFSWCKDALEGGLSKRIEPRDITVSLRDKHQQPLITWTLHNCWPVKWSVASFVTTGDQIAVESMEFAYTAMTRRVTEG